MADTLTHSQMTEDVTELVRLIAESHPDPFRYVGGAVAFNTLAEEIIENLPDRADPEAFLMRVRPLVAAVHDGHTLIGLPPSSATDFSFPLKWLILSDGLYVKAVGNKELSALIGACLVAWDGLSLEELKRRQELAEGFDNSMDLSRRLTHSLSSFRAFRAMMHPIDPPKTARLDLTFPHQSTSRTCYIDWGEVTTYFSSSVNLMQWPDLGPSQINWDVAGEETKKVICLRIGEMTHYREAYEAWYDSGFMDPLRRWWSIHYPNEPFDRAEVFGALSQIVAASTQLEQMVLKGLKMQIPWLIVDLRMASGGNSLLATILKYFLFGRKAMIDEDLGYQIPRYSSLYLANYGKLPSGASRNLGGYDFREKRAWQRRHKMPSDANEIGWYQEKPMPWIPASFREVMDRYQEGLGWHPRILVVTAAETYSAGFDVAAMLWQRGANHIGVTPAQSGNCFIDVLHYELSHSRCQGTISFKESFLYPNDPESGVM